MISVFRIHKPVLAIGYDLNSVQETDIDLFVSLHSKMLLRNNISFAIPCYSIHVELTTLDCKCKYCKLSRKKAKITTNSFCNISRKRMLQCCSVVDQSCQMMSIWASERFRAQESLSALQRKGKRRERMPYKFSTAEYADIVYVYGLWDGSTLHAVAGYERHFPNRRVPYRRVFTVYGVCAEQSDGITVFRISMMMSLMLHRCRIGSISLQSVAQTTTCTAAMTAIEPSSSFVPISLQRDVIVVHRSEIRNTFGMNFRRLLMSNRIVGRRDRNPEVQITNYMNEHKLFDKYQSGFRAGHNTSTALLKVTEDIREAIDSNKVTILTLLDLSKAFNSVNFDLLTHKLRNLHLSETAVSWFESYLRERQQCVVSGNRSSSWFNITSDRINDAIDKLNKDIDSIVTWTKKFHLNINPGKTQAIILGHKRQTDAVKHLDISPVKTLVFPHFDYADILLTDLSSDNKMKLQRAHNLCVRFVSNVRKYDHITPSLEAIERSIYNLREVTALIDAIGYRHVRHLLLYKLSHHYVE
ncbi:hypothetical protein ANN_23469 [Periplaneta americana]|uniref:Reverse transcriptase domain-containing protein n=1 Tax=Periplaneta americana TaxID=6978 RepID=A0ABQ8SLM3_PERAM|nr:hypothetical protein ANN_23469 [Periplaneta americana]